MGVRRNFSRGGNVEILLILFRLLTMQCKWTSANALLFLPISLCWLSRSSQSFVWNVFYTSAIRTAFSFDKLVNIPFSSTFYNSIIILNIISGEKNMSGEKKEVQHFRKTVSSNEKCNRMFTILLRNLLKLEHHASLKKRADELRKLATANIALRLVLTKKSELNLNVKRRISTSLHRRILTRHVFL